MPKLPTEKFFAVADLIYTQASDYLVQLLETEKIVVTDVEFATLLSEILNHIAERSDLEIHANN